MKALAWIFPVKILGSTIISKDYPFGYSVYFYWTTSLAHKTGHIPQVISIGTLKNFTDTFSDHSELSIMQIY